MNLNIATRVVVLISILAGVQTAFAQRSAHVFEEEFYTSFSTVDFFKGALHTGAQPKGANFSPDGKWLYVANMYSSYTTVVDVEALRSDPVFESEDFFVSTPKVKKQTIQWLTGFPGMSDVTQISDQTSLLKNTQAIVTEVPTPYGHNRTKAQSIEVAFTADSRFGLVSQMETSDFKDRGRVTVFDTSNKRVIAEIPTKGIGSKIIGVSKRPDAQGRIVAYVTNWFTKTTSVLDLSPTKLEALAKEEHTLGTANPELFIKTMAIPSTSMRTGKGRFGIASRGVAFTNDGEIALITNFDSRSVFVVDAQTHEPIAELPPVPEHLGGPSSMRHVVISKDDSLAYISMMGQHRILKIDLQILRQELPGQASKSIFRPDDTIWDRILLPWGDGQKSLRTIYLSPHHTKPASARGGVSQRAQPNTIVLDPKQERYLYVSNRTTELAEGKVDVVDTWRGKIIFSLGSGKHPTALAVSPDGCLLVSSEFENRRLLRFYDVCKLTQTYEQIHGLPKGLY